MSTPDTFPRPPLVLIGSAEEWTVRSVESVLSSNGFAVLRAFTAEQTLEYVRQASPDAVITETRLGDASGLELCRTMRQSNAIDAATPLILTTAGVPTHRDLMEALEAGAWDLLGMPLRSETLLGKLRVFVQAKMVADHARERSLLDDLTGLYNARGLLRRMKEIGLDAARQNESLACVALAVQSAVESGQPTLVVPADLADRFAAFLRETSRGSDAVGCLGLGEYVIIAPHTNPIGARHLASRLVDAGQRFATSASTVRVRAGFFAVDRFSETALQPVDVLVRATMALRRAQSGVDETGVWAYGDPTAPGSPN